MTKLHPDMPNNCAHYGHCALCGRWGLISTERDWCTESQNGMSGCKFKHLAAHKSGEMPTVSRETETSPPVIPAESPGPPPAKPGKMSMMDKLNARKLATGSKRPSGS